MRVCMIYFLAKLFARSLICFIAITFAADTSLYSTGFCSKQNFRVTARHIERGGIGYKQGYTTLEGFFAPNPQELTLMPFLNLRGHVFDNGKMAANVGIGLRKMAGDRIYGINTYYDYRNTKKIHYNQLGFGLETLGKFWDFRVNGYLPLGKIVTLPYQPKLIGFSGNTMLVSQKYQFAMRGAQAELGFHFEKTRVLDFYAAAGIYYFEGKIGPKIWGGKARLGCKLNDYMTIELSNSYDKLFHNRFQCQLSFTIPFGEGESGPQKTDDYYSCNTSNTLLCRMVQSVERQEIIVVGHTKKKSAAIDPTTGQPFNFVFVNNTSHSNGTYESPYPTLALAQANSKIDDIIYVFPGDGTTRGMDAGITLKLNQKFWGSGIAHALQTSQGSFIIPAQSTSAPQMTNTAGDGITLAPINQISGFILTDAEGNGINGTSLENMDISDCAIDGCQSDQIHLEYSGTSGIAALNRLTLTDGGINALFINSTTSSTACTINNCIIQDTNNSSVDATFANQAIFNFTNNTVERTVSNSTITFNGPSTLVASGNTFNDNTSINIAPLSIIAGANPLSATITNNVMSGNTCGGIHFALNNTDSAQLTINGNTFTNNGIGSIGSFGAALFMDPNGTSSGNCQLDLTNNTFSNNTGASVYCSNGNYNNFQVNAADNILMNNGGGGLVFANGCNTFTLTATNNIISGGGDHGITTGGDLAMATANITISNNQITGNTNFASAIALSHSGTDLDFTVTNNNLSQNDTSGIILFSSDTIENVAIQITNNTINNNQNLESNAASGIDLEQYTNLSGTLSNNTLSDNASPDVFIGSTQSSASVCLDMTGNSSTSGYVLSNTSGTFNLAPCDVNTVNTGTITTIGTITPVQSCPDAIPCT